MWPLTPSQRVCDLDPESAAWRRVHRFRVTFTRLPAATPVFARASINE